MPSRYRPYLSFFSDEHLKQLIYAAKIVNQVDLTVINIWHLRNKLVQSWESTRSTKTLFILHETEESKFACFVSEVARRQAKFKSLTNEGSVVEYLSNIEEVPLWMLARTVCIHLLNDDFAQSLKLNAQCPHLARLILDLGCSIIQYLKPIQAEIEKRHPDVLFACQLRLDTIKSFYVVADYVTLSYNPLEGQLSDFKKDAGDHSNTADAYEIMNESLQATLTAATLFSITLCLIPMVFAWQRSTPVKGTIDDADFWSYLQTMLMQLLSLFTMMFPISRFAPVAAWRYSWMFTAAAVVCAVATPVLYVTVATGWSGLVSYFASAAQAATVLQVMLGSNYVRNKTSPKQQ